VSVRGKLRLGLIGGAAVAALVGVTPMPVAVAAPAASPYAIETFQGRTFIPAANNIAPRGGDDFTVRLATGLSGARKMPFRVRPYGEARSAMHVSSNGNIQFPGAATSPSSAYNNSCLPTRMPSPFLAPYWDDLEFDRSATPREGIYTQTVGTAPNRKFIVNWRGHLYGQPAAGTRFGVIFYEGQSKVSFQYQDNTAASATIGTQHRPTSTSTQWACNSGGRSVETGLRLDFVSR